MHEQACKYMHDEACKCMPRRANNRENARRNERANACTTVLTPVPISSGYLSENKSQSTGHHEHENRADLVSQKGGGAEAEMFFQL